MNKNRFGKLVLAAFVAWSLSIAIPAGAVTVFYLDENSINLAGGPWASVTLSDVTSTDGRDGVHFVVDPIDSAFSKLGNFGLQSFYFNENTNFGNQLTVENFNPTSWINKYVDGFGSAGPYGKFEFLEKGTGSIRANPLTFDVFAPMNFSLSIEDLSTALSTEGYIFAAHIADFDGPGSKTSGKFATDAPPSTPVPEPGTILLLGAGLLGLGILRRRRS